MAVVLEELLAVLRGIQLAQKLGVKRIEVASDSLRVIRTINKQEEPPWDCMDQIMEYHRITFASEIPSLITVVINYRTECEHNEAHIVQWDLKLNPLV
ncbi:hypothetical protein FRX31_022276 [Thalictrum thalictroides]|uniref:RNase H type-1 domain-containing protein n=1 Tax=Thalictrum thalictroides TaxID=46969 RepID=A0A7J6VVD9_THATH|nr:hypothetical protein FRX31_022276 [Thalictrum thalictroides]